MTMQVSASRPFLPSADLASEYCVDAFQRAILLLDVLASEATTPSSRAPTTVSLSVVH